jgi:membrane associated rhomboid family serine protease
MSLQVLSIVSLAAMLAAIALGWSRRFLAVGAIALANVLVFILCELSAPVRDELALHTDALAAMEPMAFLQLGTSMFVHANFMHILGNLVVLLAFALPFEERIGPRRFLALYLASGLAGTLVEVAVTWGQPTTMMGASGAVFGVIGAFAATSPNLVIPLPLPLLFIMMFVRMRVVVAAMLFAALQFLYVLSPFADDHVAYWAHLGGLAAGLVLGTAVAKASGTRRPVAVDLKLLKPFAGDPGAQGALAKMEEYQGEPPLFQVWLERFLKGAKCPTCQHAVAPRHEGTLVCTHGHNFDVRSQKSA